MTVLLIYAAPSRSVIPSGVIIAMPGGDESRTIPEDDDATMAPCEFRANTVATKEVPVFNSSTLASCDGNAIQYSTGPSRWAVAGDDPYNAEPDSMSIVIHY